MTGPLVLITLGILFLLNNLLPEFRLSRMWPVILIVVGMSKIVEYFYGQEQGSPTPETPPRPLETENGSGTGVKVERGENEAP